MIPYLKSEIEKIDNILNHILNNKCNKCKDGFISEEKILFGQKMSFNVYCDCQKYESIYRNEWLERKQKLMNFYQRIKSNIPIDFQSKVFFELQDIRIKDFVRNDKIFLWIYGNNGNGKTSAIYAIKMEQIMRNEIYLISVVNEYNFSFNTPISGFLAIDDVYKLKSQERLRYLLPLYYNLFNYKRDNREKCIFSSNISISEFLENISKIDTDIANAIHDRMHGITEEIHFIGKSYRGENYGEKN